MPVLAAAAFVEGPDGRHPLTGGTRNANDVIHCPDDGPRLARAGRHRRHLRADGAVVSDFEREE